MRTRIYRSKRIGKYRVTASMSPSEAIFVGLLDAAGNIKLNGWLLGLALLLEYGLIYVVVSTLVIIMPSVYIGQYFGNANAGGFVGLALFFGIPTVWFSWKLWLYLKEKNTEREIERQVNERNQGS